MHESAITSISNLSIPSNGKISLFAAGLISFLVVFFPVKSWCSPKVCIILSQEYKPYFEALEGVEKVFSSTGDIEFDIRVLGNKNEKDLDFLQEGVSQKNYSLIIGIGPEAVRFAWVRLEKAEHRLYTMVLNPDEILSDVKNGCGVSLQIPIPIQIKEISYTLPGLKRLGVLYDPAYNSDFIKIAMAESRSSNAEIIPLKVTSKKEIPRVLSENWANIDGLWLIPDRTVISESIVLYIIKQGLLNEIPVMGYNRFFIESGAVLAFVLDYQKIGMQTAQIGLDVISGMDCSKAPPVFSTWLNPKIIKKLGIEINDRSSQTMKEGP